MARIYVTGSTTNTISVTVDQLGTTAKYIEFYVNNSLDKMYTLTTTSRSHTYTGLSPGTTYTLSALVYNSNWELMTFKQNSTTGSTTEEYKITIIYRDGASSATTAAAAAHTARGPFRSDMTFVGWSRYTSDTSIAYTQGQTITATSNGTLTLYAVYQKVLGTINCYYIQGDTGELNSNSRDRIQYRCNTSATASSTNFYNVVTLPSFGSSNATIPTSISQSVIGPSRSWTAIGWKYGTSAGNYDYTPGQLVAANYLTGDLYAVYSNECSITYNSNGGSGSMAKVSDTAYANASGAYTSPTLSISSCTFTAPNRPSNWAWTSTVRAGATVPHTINGDTIITKPLTATEWKNFISRIQAFATSCEVTLNSTYLSNATDGVSSGSPMKASQANAARALINQLSPKTPVPNAVSPGNEITAAFINGLKDSLNSAPGKQFSHWNVKEDDSGTKYQAGDTVSTNYNVIFYAIWVLN